MLIRLFNVLVGNVGPSGVVGFVVGCCGCGLGGG